MGLECLKPIQRCAGISSPRSTTLPQFAPHQKKERIGLQMSMHNLRINNLSSDFAQIRVQYFGDGAILIPRLDFSYRGNVLSSDGTYRAEFISELDEVDNHWVTLTLLDDLGGVFDQLKMKLKELIVGPIKHDRLLEQTKGRMLLDWRMEQIIDVSVSLSNVSVEWKNPSHSSDYSFRLSLLANSIKCVQNSRKYEKNQKVKSLGLDRIKIGVSKLREAVLKLQLVNGKCEGDSFEMFFGYDKLHQSVDFRLINLQNTTFEVREKQIRGELRSKNQVQGYIGFNLTFNQSRIYAQQIECLVQSEDGIVLISPGQKERDEVLDWQVTQVLEKKLRGLRKDEAGDVQLYRLLDEIQTLTVGKEFSATDDVLSHQQLLLTLLAQVAQLLQYEQQLKRDYAWSILNEMCRKDILTLKYFSCIKSEESKKMLALKFYRFMVVTLIKIIRLTEKALSFKEVLEIHRFVAFVYFRFPFCQHEIIEAISSPTDPSISQEKMNEIGANRSLKYCQKSYFYDWQTSLFRLIEKQPQFIDDIQRLLEIKAANPKWATLLFGRDCQQLFYSLYECLWDQAQLLLNCNDRILWQYFPHYDVFLSIFMGQLNHTKVISKEMMHCNMRLMSNSKLMNTFMMLIFPKSCLSEIYTVLQCLDLMKGYFEVVQESGHKLPADFRYSYFKTGIIAILESNHAALLQKILGIIFTFYEIFAEDFKETMKAYFINKAFFQLFLHWSQEVRNIFHLLMVFKMNFFTDRNSGSSNMKEMSENKGSEKYLKSMVDSLYLLKLNRDKFKKDDSRYNYFQRMRQKLKQKEKFKKDESTYLDECQLEEKNSVQKSSRHTVFPTPSRGQQSQSSIISLQGIEPSNEELRYIDIALKQFEHSKMEPHPNEIVSARSKMLLLIIDH